MTTGSNLPTGWYSRVMIESEAVPADIVLVDDEVLPAPVSSALSMRPVQHRTELPGGPVAWLSWGSPANPPLIFVHGGAAHSWWWSFVAPLFAQQYYVVSMDCYGHGDSGRLERYSFERWAQQIFALAESLFTVPPLVVGHSMGGLITAVAAATGHLAGAVIVDAPIGPPTDTRVGEADATLARPKLYPTREIAVSRFRPLPDQPHNSAGLVRFIAERSVVATGGGWGWKFDYRMFSEHPADRPNDLLATLALARCPVGVITGETSDVVSAGDRDAFAGMAGDSSGPVVSAIQIPDGGHHLMFDKPVELYRAIEQTIALLTRPNGEVS